MRGIRLDSLARKANINLSHLESGPTLEGWLGGAFRRIAYWYRQPTANQKLRVSRAWLSSLKREGPQAALK